MAKIMIAKEEDRLAVAAILVKNKYTVRQTKLRKTGSKSYDHFIEYTDTGCFHEESPGKEADEE